MKPLLFTTLSLIFAVFGNTEDDLIRQKNFRLNSANIAMNGYDPVSYFRAGPEKGSKSIIHLYRGIYYWFKTEANRDEFISNPGKYEPAWGGWCGHAMALQGEKVEINPLCYFIKPSLPMH
jgi:YHS domain-containing protein